MTVQAKFNLSFQNEIMYLDYTTDRYMFRYKNIFVRNLLLQHFFVRLCNSIKQTSE